MAMWHVIGQKMINPVVIIIDDIRTLTVYVYLNKF